MKMKNRYNRKLKYRTHHELNTDFSNSRLWLFWTLVLTPIISFLGYFEFTHPSIGPIEFTLFLVSIFYLFILKPLIMQGRITAFYRRSYKNLSWIIMVYSRIAMIATGKVIGTCLFYLIFTRDIDFIMELAQILFKPFHPVYSTAVVIISLILFFLIYYQDRYTTIREYSNGINFRIKELNLGIGAAIKDFMAQQDEEHGIKEFNGTYYDYEEQKKEIKEETDSQSNKPLLRRTSRS